MWILYLPRDVFGSSFDFLVSQLARNGRSQRPRNHATLFLRFSSFPPFIRAPVVNLRPVSWFLLCHTRPYTYIHRGPSFYRTLGWVILRLGLSLSFLLSSSLRNPVTLRRVAGTINLRLLRR